MTLATLGTAVAALRAEGLVETGSRDGVDYIVISERGARMWETLTKPDGLR